MVQIRIVIKFRKRCKKLIPMPETIMHLDEATVREWVARCFVAVARQRKTWKELSRLVAVEATTLWAAKVSCSARRRTKRILALLLQPGLARDLLHFDSADGRTTLSSWVLPRTRHHRRASPQVATVPSAARTLSSSVHYWNPTTRHHPRSAEGQADHRSCPKALLVARIRCCQGYSR